GTDGWMPDFGVFRWTEGNLKELFRSLQNTLLHWLVWKIRPHRLRIEIVSDAAVLLIPEGAAIGVNSNHFGLAIFRIVPAGKLQNHGIFPFRAGFCRRIEIVQ